MEGASADANGGRMALVDNEGSKDDILAAWRRYSAVESFRDYSLLSGCMAVWQ